MKEQLTITTERVDDIALLVAHMQRMGLDSLLDKHRNNLFVALGKLCR